MRFDIQSLGTINELADNGAQEAADSLGQLTGRQITAEATHTDIISIPDIVSEFSGEEFAGVKIDITDGLDGTVMLVFDSSSTVRLLESVMPDSWGEVNAEMDRSGVCEIANIMIGRFVGTLADHCSTKIRVSPPEYVAGEWPDILSSHVPKWDERKGAMSFTSQITTEQDPIDFTIYLFPEPDSFRSLFSEAFAGDPLPISTEQISAFNELARAGSDRAAEKVQQMTGFETDVEVSRFAFIPIDGIEGYINNENQVATSAGLQDAPGGYITVSFDKVSAQNIADSLLPIETDGSEFTEQHKSAIQEIGNIMTSGFIDGWANTTQRTIQHSPPTVSEGDRADVLHGLVKDVDDKQEHLFLFDSTVEARGKETSFNIFLLPHQEKLQKTLNEISVDQATTAADNPEQLEPDSPF